MSSYAYAQPKRNVDFVLCIDGTAGMTPCIDAIKTKFASFLAELTEWIRDSGVRPIDTLRAKVIVFRDYRDDGEDAMVESVFFDLPDENADFKGFLSSITVGGGGDYPENGLEALHFAMNADFCAGKHDRQVVLLFSNSDALELGERKDWAAYPSDMVDEADFIRAWGAKKLDRDAEDGCTPAQKNRRMFLFAPPKTRYELLSKTLRCCYFEPIENMSAFFDESVPRYLAQMMGPRIFC